MKRITSILMCLLILMTSTCIWASASAEESNTYSYVTEDAEYTVVFNDNNLTAEEQETVAAKLVGANINEAVPANILCDIFGHDYKYTTTSVLTHKVNATAPRCRKQNYDVKYCEDCDYTQQTLTSTTYIVCCA